MAESAESTTETVFTVYDLEALDQEGRLVPLGRIGEADYTRLVESCQPRGQVKRIASSAGLFGGLGLVVIATPVVILVTMLFGISHLSGGPEGIASVLDFAGFFRLVFLSVIAAGIIAVILFGVGFRPSAPDAGDDREILRALGRQFGARSEAIALVDDGD